MCFKYLLNQEIEVSNQKWKSQHFRFSKCCMVIDPSFCGSTKPVQFLALWFSDYCAIPSVLFIRDGRKSEQNNIYDHGMVPYANMQVYFRGLATIGTQMRFT